MSDPALSLFHSDPAGDLFERLSVRELFERFQRLAQRDNDARTIADRAKLYSAFAAQHGAEPVERMRPLHLELFIAEHPAWRSDWTIKRVGGYLQRPFAWAAKMGLIARNPLAGWSHREGESGRPIRPEEFQAMLRAADPVFRRVLIFLRFTGCRPCEMAALEWSHLDLDRAALVLTKHKTSKRQKEKRPRVFPLHPVIVGLLIYQSRMAIPGQSRIFINSKGQAWTRNALALRLSNMRRRAGLPKNCNFYGLRHGFGTMAILKGLDIKTLAELMGHASVRTTERYVHLAGELDHLNQAVLRVMG